MPSNLSYDLYDTANFTNSASNLFSLFQSAQGSAATLTKAFTNSRGAGQLPQNEDFSADWLGVFLDEIPSLADASAVWRDSYCEVRVNDETVLLTPLRRLAALNSYSGHFTQAVAADAAGIGLQGMGLALAIPIMIPGGTAFRVDLFQGTALAVATQAVRFVMSGTLVRN